MLLRALALLLSLAAVSLHAQGNLLGFNWQLRHGDNPAWVSAPIDAEWSPINLGISWERQNHNHGDAWLRTEVRVPASLEAGGLTLEVTLPAQAVDVFLNGQRVAATGGASERLTVDLPSSAFRWGETNQLALRILGHPWTGGRAQDSVRLVPRGSGRASTCKRAWRRAIMCSPPRPRSCSRFPRGRPRRRRSRSCCRQRW